MIEPTCDECSQVMKINRALVGTASHDYDISLGFRSCMKKKKRGLKLKSCSHVNIECAKTLKTKATIDSSEKLDL